MIPQLALSARIAAWTREAFEKWGDDWPHISAYIERRMISLEPGERLDLATESALTLLSADDGSKH
jgi:hypothetical protein